jgi:hypothetical protein
MKMHCRSLLLLCLTTLLLLGTALVAEPRPQSAASKPEVPIADGAKNAKVADLAFLSGRWEGTVDGNKIHQVCNLTDPATMLCMFWLNDAKGTQMIELYTLRDTPEGVEERARFLTPALNEEAGDKGLTMKLASYMPRQMVFENPNGTYPKRSTLTRVGDDRFTSRIELIDAQGKQSLIEAHWTKAQ